MSGKALTAARTYRPGKGGNEAWRIIRRDELKRFVEEQYNSAKRGKYIRGGTIMAFVITDECLSCGACAAQCPAEAIDMGELHYEIDAEKCLDCGSCAAQCPAEAIVSP